MIYPLFIIGLLFLCLVSAVLAYKFSSVLFESRANRGAKRKQERLVRFLIAFAFFAMPLAANRFVGFRPAIVLCIVEIIFWPVVIFYLEWFRKRRKVVKVK